MTLQIIVNGQPQTLHEGCTVRHLLEQTGLADAPCAVEVNRELVPRRRHEQRILTEGDRVEIVTLVGGG